MASAQSAAGRVFDELRVAPGTPANLAGRDTSWSGGEEFEHLSTKKLDEAAKRILAEGIEQLKDAQELLWASDTYALLVVFQAMDAAGKDSTIEHVMSGVNPQGVQVVSFKQPSTEELDHSYPVADLQEHAANAAGSASSTARTTRRSSRSGCTPTGSSASTCRPAIVVRRSGRSVTTTSTPSSATSTATASRSSSSSCTSRRRSRSDASWRGSINPEKNWKFSAADVAERAHWDEYMQAYDDAITATSTEWAPWYVIPADNKRVMQAMAVSVIVETINSLDLQWPIVSDAARQANAEARELLEAEPD